MSSVQNFLTGNTETLVTDIGSWTVTAGTATLSTSNAQNKIANYGSLLIERGSSTSAVTVNSSTFTMGSAYSGWNTKSSAWIWSDQDIQVVTTTSITQVAVSYNVTSTTVVKAQRWTLVVANETTPGTIESTPSTVSMSLKFSTVGSTTLLAATQIFVTSPIVSTPDASALNTFAAETYMRLPEYLRDADGTVSNPTFPLYRFIDVAFNRANDVYDLWSNIRYLDPNDEGGYQNSQLVNPDTAKEEWLPWIASILGAKLGGTAPTGYTSWASLQTGVDANLDGVPAWSEWQTVPDISDPAGVAATWAEIETFAPDTLNAGNEARWQVSSAGSGIKGGTSNALRSAAQHVLTGTKSVTINGNVGGDPWKIEIVTLLSETPDVVVIGGSSGTVLDAVELVIPAGFEVVHRAANILAALGAVVALDAAQSVLGEQAVVNQGSASSTLNARYGTGSSVDGSDPLLLTHTGTNYLYLTGASTNYVSIPDNPALGITGDIEIVCRAALDDWTPTANSRLVSKRTSGRGAYELFITTNGKICWDAVGLTASVESATAPPFTNGTAYWVRVQRVSSTGVVTFAWAADQASEPTSWTTLAGVGTQPSGALSVTTDPLYIGTYGGTADMTAGKFYRAIVRNGFPSGTTVADVDFTTGITSGNQISLPYTGSASVSSAPQYVGNLGTGGRALVARSGSLPNADGNDPLLLTHNGTNYLYLPGVNGNYASIPDNPALSITGNIQLTLRIASDILPLAAQAAFIGKCDGGSTRSYYLEQATDGRPILTLSADGTTNTTAVTAMVAPPYASKVPYWLKVEWRQSDGRVQFFHAADQSTEPSSWIQLGTDLNISIPSIFVSTSRLEIGTRILGTLPMPAKFYRAIIRSGASWTVTALDVDFTTGITSGDQVSVPFTGTGLTTSTPQYVSNLGTGGRALVAKVGSSNITDTNDPLLLNYTGENHLYLAGSVNNYVSVPDNGALELVGSNGSKFLACNGSGARAQISNTYLPVIGGTQYNSLEIVMRLAVDYVRPASDHVLMSKGYAGTFFLALNNYNSAASSVGIDFSVITGTGTYFNQSNIPLTLGTVFWLKATRNSTTGVCSFYSAPDQTAEPTTWTFNASAGGSVQAGALVTNTTDICIGAGAVGNAPSNTRIYRAILRPAIGIAFSILDLDFTKEQIGTTSLLDVTSVANSSTFSGIPVNLVGGAQIVDGSTFLSLTGAVGNYASTPDSANLDILGVQGTRFLSLAGTTSGTEQASITPLGGNGTEMDITGDIEIAARIHYMGNASTGPGAIFNRRGSGGAYRLMVNGGASKTLDFTIWSGGSAFPAISTAAIPTGEIWVKATRTTAGVTFFYTSTDGLTFTQLGASISGTPGAIDVNTGNSLIGGTNGTEAFFGRIYRVVVTGALDADFTIAPIGAASFNTSTGQTITLTGATTKIVDGTTFLRLPGGASATGGNYAYIPNSTALNITGNLEVVMRLSMDRWTSLNPTQTLFSRWNNPGGVGGLPLSYRVDISGGSWLFLWSADGAISSGPGLGIGVNTSHFVNGTTTWVRFRFAVATGTFTVDYAADATVEPSSWTFSASATTGASTTLNHVGTSNLEFGSTDGTVYPLGGRIYRGIVRNGFDGTTAVDADFSHQIQFANSFIERSGASVVLVGNGARIERQRNYEIVTRVALDKWNLPSGSNPSALTGKWVTTGNLRSYMLLCSPGALVLHTSVDGTASYGSQSVSWSGFVDGVTYWVKATKNVFTGVASFYYAADQVSEPTSWTLIGTNTPSGVEYRGSPYVSSAPLEIGSIVNGSTYVSAGKFYRTIVRNDIDGFPIFDSDFSKQAALATTFTEGSLTAASVTVNSTNTASKITSGTTFLTTTGSILNAASAAVPYQIFVPTNASYNLGNDFEIVFKVTPASTAINSGLVVRDGSWRVLAGGSDPTALALWGSADGVNWNAFVTSSSTGILVTGTTRWYKVSRVAQNIFFYYAANQTSEPTTWTTAGSATSTATIVNVANPVQIGCRDGGLGNFSGRIYNAKVRSGVAASATTVLDIDFTQQTQFAASFTERSSLAATVTLPASQVYARIERNRDLELVCRAATEDWSSANRVLSSSIVTGSLPDRKFRWKSNNDKTLSLEIYPTGLNPSGIISYSSAVPAFVNNVAYWFKVTADMDNGTGQYTISHYWAADQSTEPTVWTAIGTTNGSTGPLSIIPSSNPYDFGSAYSGTSESLTGKLYRSIVRDGIDGPAIVDLDFTKQLTSGSQTSVAVAGSTSQIIKNVGATGAALNAKAGKYSSTLDISDPLYLPFYGDKYWYQPSTVAGGNYIGTPSTADLEFTGDIAVAVCVQLDETFVSKGLLIKRSTGAGNPIHINLSADRYGTLSTLTLSCTLSDTTSMTLTGLLGHGIAIGQKAWLGASLDVNNGSNGYTVKYYRSFDGVNWDNYETRTVTGTTLTRSTSSTSLVGVGGTNLGVAGTKGKYYAAKVWDGLNLTANPVLNWSANDMGQTGGTSNGRVWTPNRTGNAGRKGALVDRPVWLFGADDSMEIPDHADLNFDAPQSFTVVAVVRQWATPSSFGRYVSKETATVGYNLLTNSTLLQPYFGIKDATASINAVPSAAASAGLLTTITGVRNNVADTVTTYVNTASTSASTSTTDTTTATLSNTNPLIIGNSSFTTANQDFELVAVAVFRSALSAASVTLINNHYTVAADANAVALLSTAKLWIDASLSQQMGAITRSTSGHKSVAVVRPTYLFGGNDYMDVLDNDLLDFALTDSFTMVAALRQWGSPSNDVRIFSKGSAGTPTAPAISFLQKSSFGTSLRIDAGTTGQTSESFSPVPAAGALTVFSGVRNASTDSLVAYSGASAGASVADITTLAVANTAPFRIGADYGSGTAVYFGEFEMYGAAVFRSALTPENVALIDAHYKGSETPESIALLSTAVLWIDPFRSKQEMAINRGTTGKKAVAVTRPTFLFGTNSYMEVADNNLLDFGANQDYTVLAFVNTFGTPSANEVFVGKGQYGNVGVSLVQNATSGNIAYQAGSPFAANYSYLTTNSVTGSRLLAGGRSGSTAFGYADNTALSYGGGAVAGSQNLDVSDAYPLRIGANGGATANTYAHFELFGAAVFRKALTATEVALINTHYQGTETTESVALLSSAVFWIDAARSPQEAAINRGTTGRKSVAVTRPIWLFALDDYMEIADSPLLQFGTEENLTVLAVYRQWGTVTQAPIISRRNNGAAPNGWELDAGYTGGVGTVSTTSNFVTGGYTAPTPGTLSSLTMTRSSAGLIGYINNTAGTPVITAGYYGNSNPSVAETIKIGARYTAASTFADMELVAVGVFRKALTATEIAQINAYYGIS